MSETGGVVEGDLVASGASATFTGRLVGTTKIRAVIQGITQVDSRLIRVVPGPATQITIETLANGNGQTVSDQGIALGGTLTVYAVTRDALGNFVANVSADSWSVVDNTGSIGPGNLTTGFLKRNATFNASSAGSAKIRAAKAGLTSIDSGTITVLTH